MLVVCKDSMHLSVECVIDIYAQCSGCMDEESIHIAWQHLYNLCFRSWMSATLQEQLQGKLVCSLGKVLRQHRKVQRPKVSSLLQGWLPLTSQHTFSEAIDLFHELLLLFTYTVRYLHTCYILGSWENILLFGPFFSPLITIILWLLQYSHGMHNYRINILFILNLLFLGFCRVRSTLAYKILLATKHLRIFGVSFENIFFYLKSGMHPLQNKEFFKERWYLLFIWRAELREKDVPILWFIPQMVAMA